jgi:hypothetical protein
LFTISIYSPIIISLVDFRGYFGNSFCYAFLFFFWVIVESRNVWEKIGAVLHGFLIWIFWLKIFLPFLRKKKSWPSLVLEGWSVYRHALVRFVPSSIILIGRFFHWFCRIQIYSRLCSWCAKSSTYLSLTAGLSLLKVGVVFLQPAFSIRLPIQAELVGDQSECFRTNLSLKEWNLGPLSQ